MARSNLQSLRRYEENVSFIRHNNFLMHSTYHDRNKVYASLRKARGEKNSKLTMLHTPVGTYYGEDVLEGFAADAENLAQSNENCSNFNQSFYKLCKLDNVYIFELEEGSQVQIPPMTINQLEAILNTKMKLGKSCDIYQLTVEHLRFCGDKAKEQVLHLINSILTNISALACPQVKLGLGKHQFSRGRTS